MLYREYSPAGHFLNKLGICHESTAQKMIVNILYIFMK